MTEPSGTAPRRCRRWVVVLEGDGVESDVVGGKAAAIDRLVAAGFPVPASAAVSVDAYRHFVEQEPIRDVLEQGTALDDTDDVDAEFDRLEKVFLDEPVPPQIDAAITRAVEAIAGRTGSSATVAARSSATVEDAGSASYAGQFATELGCEPGTPLLDAVRRVWASAWSPAVRSYRRAMDADAPLHMGVLLMDMVDAQHAGVVFTRSPEDDERLRIETVEGLGEKLVSGQVTPDRKLVSRTDPAGDLDDSDPPFWAELVETALAIEQELGDEPQDIEWAHDGDQLWILQTRPVTVDATAPASAEAERPPDDGFDSEPDGHVHTPNGVNEMLPGVVPPLVWTMAAPLLEEAFRSLFAGLGALPSDDLRHGHRFVARFRGRAALDLDLLRAAARLMPGQSEAELERQYFGDVVSADLQEEQDDAGGGGIRALLPVWRAVRLRGAQRREAAIVNVATDRLLDGCPDLNSLSNDALASYHDRLLDLAARAITAEVAVAASAAAAYRTLERYLSRLVEHDASELAQRLTAGGVPACKAAALDVCALLDAACEDPDLARTLARGDDDGVLERVRHVEGGEGFLEQFGRILEREGSARVFAGERWCDRPEAALATVRQALRRADRDELDPRARLGDLERRLTSTWRWRAGRVYTGQVVDVRIRLLRRTVADAIELLRLREETKRTVLRIGGEVRRVVEHVADGLARAGHLPQRTDVELLGHDELLGALAGHDLPTRDELEQRRAALRRMGQLGSLPRRFDDRPGRATAEASTSDVLGGWAAGPGRHAGRPVVVTDLRGADLHEGDVLVATSTDPSWTPLFVTAGAVVVEQGGPLSHAAIVAREFGLPAVLNVPGATERLRGVEQVAVDGTAGTVEILDGPS